MPHKIEVPFEKLEHVIHLADIHIRLFKRHEEYKDCFYQLYEDVLEQLKDKKNTVILVAGDIVHAKTDMSPEMVQLASELLCTLADLAPTIVIAGNHDLNLANMHRLDALTPIIDNLGHPNLNYLKHSGVYRIADTDFAVHSILDNRTEWPDVSKSTAPNKVALYHGPIYGATTDGNYTITERHVFIDMFRGYDMVMLGDIHKYQVLQTHDKEKKLPEIVYSSSLIQQNHGESVFNHGWCLWNIPARTHEFRELYSKYKYYTLEMNGNKLTFPTNMPENVRLRLFTGNADETVIKKTVSSLRRKYNIIELSVNRTKYSSGFDRKRIDLLELGDLTDVNVQNNLIHEWLHNVPGPQISNALTSKVLEINKKLNAQLAHEDQSRNVHWRPIQLKFSNIFSYGEDNVISFENMSGTYGIFAPNASGKSAAMDALIFALFDKTPRAFKGDHIMNNRKSKFSVDLQFEVDQKQYIIMRRGTRKKNGAVKVAVDFLLVNDDGTFQSLNGQERSDTNANIRSLIGTYDDFILTALSSQNSNSLFIDKSHSERKDLLNQFMGLTIFDKLERIANDHSKEVYGALRKFKSDDFTTALADIQIELDELQQKYNSAVEVHTKLLHDITDLDSTLNTLYNEKLPIEGGVINLEDCTRQKEKLQQKITVTFDSEITVLTKTLEELSKEVESYEKTIEFREEWEITTVMETAQLIRNKISALDKEITKKSTQINSIRKQIKWLDNHEYDPNCSYCVNNVFFKEALKEKDKLNGYQEILSAAELDKKNELATLQDTEETLNKYREQLAKKTELSNKKTKILNTQLTLQQVQVKKIDAEKQILEIDNKITKYHAQEKSLQHNAKIDETINEFKRTKEDLQRQAAQSESRVRTLHGQIEVSKSKKEDIMRRLNEAVELEMEYEGYKYYMEAVGRDGVPYDLITKVIPSIEAEINNILSQIVDFNVTLTVDDKNINGKIVYDYERLWPLENSSGMERFISSLAIRVALMKASNLPKPNFLVLDEGMGTLDAENLHSMATLFSFLKTQFDFVIIISHLDTVRDMVDNLVEIKKEDGFSFIQYV